MPTEAQSTSTIGTLASGSEVGSGLDWLERATTSERRSCSTPVVEMTDRFRILRVMGRQVERSMALALGTNDLYIVTSDGNEGQGATIFHAKVFAKALPLYSHQEQQ